MTRINGNAQPFQRKAGGVEFFRLGRRRRSVEDLEIGDPPMISVLKNLQTRGGFGEVPPKALIRIEDIQAPRPCGFRQIPTQGSAYIQRIRFDRNSESRIQSLDLGPFVDRCAGPMGGLGEVLLEELLQRPTPWSGTYFVRSQCDR